MKGKNEYVSWSKLYHVENEGLLVSCKSQTQTALDPTLPIMQLDSVSH